MFVISRIPAVRHTRALSLLALALVLSACGGGDGPGVIEPPPPDNVAATVEIVSPADSVRANQTLQLSATAKNAAGVVLSGKTFNWQSASDAVATVTAAGLVTAHGPGRVTLTAIETASGRSGSMSLSVLPAPVATLAITPAAITIQEGATQPLAATARDANGNVLAGRAVVWSSADATIAAVDAATGVVRGVRAGAGTTITATVEGKSATAEVTVTPVPVASLAMEPALISLHPGGTRTLAITARDAAGNVLPGRPVTLVSSDASVATVSGGVVTAAGVGSATITASAEGRTASATVSVTLVPVASLTMEPASITLYPGGTQTLTITARDAAGNVLPGRAVTLVSSNAFVATVSGGVVTAVGVGMGTVEAMAEGRTARSSVTVIPVPVASLTIEPSPISLYVGATQALAITARDAAGNVLPGRTVTLSTSNSAVAALSGGVVTGMSVGSATITATTEGGPTATAPVNVGETPVASVTIDPVSFALHVGQTRTPILAARGPAGDVLPGRRIALVSSNPSVVVVEGDSVRATGVGTATLTATSEGKSATSSVTVTPAPVAYLTMEPSFVQLTLGGARALTITAHDGAGNALPGRAVTLVSSDASVATVSGNVVTGAGLGLTTITAECEGKTATSHVQVTRVPVASVTLSSGTFTLKPGETRQLTATLRDSTGAVLTGREVSWGSTEPGVAVVSPSGLATGMGEGLTVITASSEGKTGSVTMTGGVASRVELAPGFSVLDVGASTKIGITAFTPHGYILSNPTVQWTSLSAAVAGVDGSGTVTGASAGQARVVATVDAARDTTVVAVLGAQSLLSTAFAGGQVKAYVRSGQTITVPVVLDLSKVSAGGDLGAAQFQLAYDPAVLVYQSASAGVSGTADFNVPTPGTFRFSFAGTNPQGTARLTLVTITFQVASGAALGTQRALTLTYTAQPANTSFAKYAFPVAVSGRVQVVQ